MAEKLCGTSLCLAIDLQRMLSVLATIVYGLLVLQRVGLLSSLTFLCHSSGHSDQ